MPERPLPRPESDALVHDATAGMERLLEIMARLRAPDGCPWDIEQGFDTIAPYTLEEAHEVADAIARQDWAELKSELGDLLFQSVFHDSHSQNYLLDRLPIRFVLQGARGRRCWHRVRNWRRLILRGLIREGCLFDLRRQKKGIEWHLINRYSGWCD